MRRLLIIGLSAILSGSALPPALCQSGVCGECKVDGMAGIISDEGNGVRYCVRCVSSSEYEPPETIGKPQSGQGQGTR